ncbi:MAG: GNAT family N-acetyltransferase [Armatimonadota bacterium]
MEYDRLEPQLAMYRPHLENLPPTMNPNGVHIQTYRRGDEEAWDSIVAASFEWEVTPGEFDRTMKSDPEFDPERVFFAAVSGELVGTAAAWRIPECGENTGRVHMVAVKPGYRGKHIGTALSTAVLHRFREEGRDDATLRTDDFRIPGIKIYLNLGFQPYLVDENQRRRWRKVFQVLGMPDLEETFRDLLDGPIHELKI